MMATGHSQALSEKSVFPICGSESLFFRSHLKGNWENAPQCLTLPRALVPPRGERAPRTLRSTNPAPRPWRALRGGARSGARCATSGAPRVRAPAPLARHSPGLAEPLPREKGGQRSAPERATGWALVQKIGMVTDLLTEDEGGKDPETRTAR